MTLLILINVVSLLLPSWHSHTMSTFQLSFLSREIFFLSLFLLLPIFFSQNSPFVFGKRESGQLSCACQKQPFTKMTMHFFLMTMSGRLGKVVCMRYRIPWANRNLRTNSSGLVFLPLIRDIFQVRFAGVSLSAILLNILPQMQSVIFNDNMVMF